MPASRRSVIVVAALGAALTVATGAFVPASATAPAGSTARYSVSTGTFDVPATATSAFTYDVTQVPVGARIVVQAVKIAHHKTLIRLRVRG